MANIFRFYFLIMEALFMKTKKCLSFSFQDTQNHVKRPVKRFRKMSEWMGLGFCEVVYYITTYFFFIFFINFFIFT